MPRKKIDVRTKTMSPAAKKCRAIGVHAMDFVPVSPARRLELAQRGQYAERMVCLRGCSRWREQVFDADTDELVATSGDYLDKDSYLVQARGTGRLSRAAARAAYHASVSEPELAPAVPLPEAWQPPLRRARPKPVAVPAQPAVESAAKTPRQRGSRRKAATGTP